MKNKDEGLTSSPNDSNAFVGGCSFSQEQIDNRISDYVCFDCGLQFLSEEQKKKEGVTTAHVSNCGLCQKEKSVIHIRHWNWLRLPKISAALNEGFNIARQASIIAMASQMFGGSE